MADYMESKPHMLETQVFDDEGPVNRLWRETVQPSHVDPKLGITVETGKLDFSFTKLEKIEDLKMKEPRDGKRKPIEEPTDEQDEANQKQLEQQKQEEEEKNEEENKQKEKKEEVIKDHHGLRSQAQQLLQNFDMPLSQAKNNMFGARKTDEEKHDHNKKKVVKTKCASLFLNNNELRELTGMSAILSKVMWGHNNLLWLDLSSNYLTKIDLEIDEFPNLKTLYLHANYITEMEEVEKLQNLASLRILTLHGNEIEQIPGYRLYVIGCILEKNANLKKFDTVLITKKERDAVIVWNTRLNSKKRSKLKIAEPRQPPAKEEEEGKEEKKQ